MNSLKLLFLLSCGLSMSSTYLFTAAAAEERKEEIMESHNFSYGKENMAFVANLYQLSQPMRDEILRSFQEITPLDALINKGFYVQEHPVSLKEVHDLLTASVNNESLLEYLKRLSIEQLLKAFHISENLAINNSFGAVKKAIKDYIDTIPVASLDEAVAYSGQELKPKTLILAKERKEFAPELWSLSTLLVNAFNKDPHVQELPLNDSYLVEQGITLTEIHHLLGAASSGNEKLTVFLDSLSLSQLLKMLKTSNYLNIHVGDTDITNAVAQSITKKTREASPDTSMPEAIPFAALKDQQKLDQDLENLLKKTFDAERFKYIKSGATLYNRSPIRSVAWSPDGKTLASGSWDGPLKIWDPASGTELRTLRGHTGTVYSVAWSPDGKTIASGSYDKTLKIWDAASGTELRTLKGHRDPVLSVAWSPDGKTIASGSYDNTIKIWDPATGTELRTLKGHTSSVFSIAWSPDGKTLASGSDDRTINIWDPASGTELHTLHGHKATVSSVVWSTDSKTIASGSVDNTIKIWDLATGNELNTLKGHTKGVTGIRWSPDGKTLASGSWDETIRLWIIPSIGDKLLAQMYRTLQLENITAHSPFMSMLRPAKTGYAEATAVDQNSSDDSDFSNKQIAQAAANFLKEQAEPAAASAIGSAEPQLNFPASLHSSIHEEKENSDDE